MRAMHGRTLTQAASTSSKDAPAVEPLATPQRSSYNRQTKRGRHSLRWLGGARRSLFQLGFEKSYECVKIKQDETLFVVCQQSCGRIYMRTGQCLFSTAVQNTIYFFAKAYIGECALGRFHCGVHSSNFYKLAALVSCTRHGGRPMIKSSCIALVALLMCRIIEKHTHTPTQKATAIKNNEADEGASVV